MKWTSLGMRYSGWAEWGGRSGVGGVGWAEWGWRSGVGGVGGRSGVGGVGLMEWGWRSGVGGVGLAEWGWRSGMGGVGLAEWVGGVGLAEWGWRSGVGGVGLAEWVRGVDASFQPCEVYVSSAYYCNFRSSGKGPPCSFSSDSGTRCSAFRSRHLYLRPTACLVPQDRTDPPRRKRYG